MATGGAACEEELYSFELFECSVCLESLINKQPRLLSCGHTFCTPCLQQLSGGNTVNCPKCRSLTRLPPGGVQALPKNTDINKMREREQELSARSDFFCQMCRKRMLMWTSFPLHVQGDRYAKLVATNIKLFQL